jgi:hypothetical protein
MFTWIGMFTSDSGRESILKLVFERNGLSGIIFVEQEVVNKEKNATGITIGFQILNMR